MLLRLVRPVRRKDSRIPYFVQRIPLDIKKVAVGLKLDIPVGDNFVRVVISAKALVVKVSLQTDDPREAKVRQAAIAGYLETVWQALREGAPVPLTNKQATALAKDLYLAWANGEGRERTIGIRLTADRKWEQVTDESLDDEPEIWEAASRNLDDLAEKDDPAAMERAFGPIIDRLLLQKGIRRVDRVSRQLLFKAFRLALQDAFESRKRNAGGDYSRDVKADRFPAWEAPLAVVSSLSSQTSAGMVSLKGLVDEWWAEAKAGGRTISTFESYRNSIGRLAAFLGHDDASRVTNADIIGFKNHRLAQGISIKTVRDSDLVGFNSVFNWAVGNKRMSANPVEGLKLRAGRTIRTRSQGFTAQEASELLAHALQYRQLPRESPKTAAAKRWVPFLCAYTGARVGEIVQLRKQDVRCEKGVWLITITPEAGTVKDKKSREVVLHEHLVELGFPAFAEASGAGYLFLSANLGDDIRGVWQAIKNRLTDFAREVVTDAKVAPNHGWRHTFKTIGREVGIEDSVLDGICGHAPSNVGGKYGALSVAAQVRAFRMFPRFRDVTD
jgi:integrase